MFAARPPVLSLVEVARPVLKLAAAGGVGGCGVESFPQHQRSCQSPCSKRRLSLARNSSCLRRGTETYTSHILILTISQNHISLFWLLWLVLYFLFRILTNYIKKPSCMQSLSLRHSNWRRFKILRAHLILSLNSTNFRSFLISEVNYCH